MDKACGADIVLGAPHIHGLHGFIHNLDHLLCHCHAHAKLYESVNGVEAFVVHFILRTLYKPTKLHHLGLQMLTI